MTMGSHTIWFTVLLVTAAVFALANCDSENLALNKQAWQISEFWDHPASMAVDGDRNPDYWNESCSHTDFATRPWLTVDLGDEYLVTMVTITNRGDCCPERLRNFKVAVGETFDPSEFDPTSFTTCVYVAEPLGEAETRTIPCDNPVQGRYVTVYLQWSHYLTICELEVYSGPPPPEMVNLALHKPAWQSTTLTKYEDYYGFIPTADFAVDGNLSPVFDDGSCSHTWTDPTPWFTVDLLSEYAVTEVVITNRGDCCAERLADFTVAVGNSFDEENLDNFDPRSFSECARVSGELGTSETRTIRCDNEVAGRYVTVYINKKGILTLCELQVHSRDVTVSGGSGGSGEIII